MDNKKFGRFIQRLRQEQGWTQKDLADKIFVTDKAVSKWERGLSFPDIELLIPIADAFGVTVLELLKGEKENYIEEDINEIVVETLKNSRIKRKKKMPIWKKILIALCIWFCAFQLDYFIVVKFYRAPFFSINTTTSLITKGTSHCIEKRYIGLGYTFYTKGQYVNNRYEIHYCVIKLFGHKIKMYYKGVTE